MSISVSRLWIPYRLLRVDAAIIFADILPPLESMGLSSEFAIRVVHSDPAPMAPLDGKVERTCRTIPESIAGWATRLQHRYIGDFTNWQDDAVYQQAFTTLLQCLKLAQPKTV